MKAATRRRSCADPAHTQDQSTQMPSAVGTSSELGRNADDHRWSFGVGSQEREPVAPLTPAQPSFDVCPRNEQIRAFVAGRLDASEVSSVDTHMSACPSCSARVLEALSARTQCPIPIQEGPSCLSLDLGACLADRYLVYRSLGQGGMGEVYEAFDVELQQPVAIKTIRATTCDNPEAPRRLAREFDLARSIRHPNVRRMYQLGIHEIAEPRGAAFPFISMELIEGQSLAKYVRAGGIGLETFGWIASALFRGVAAIHRAGIIHRDIKSHNVLLRTEPGPQLAIIDFGLAADAGRVGRDHCGDSLGLEACALEGSLAYMAPEQFNGAGVGFASDVFSSGVVLFQLLTGKLPFRSLRSRPSARVWRDPREVPCRVRALAPELPAWVDSFVGRCLELDARARYADASEALAVLQASPARP